ncbi:MAG: hypothetical protein HC893_11105 [Chloroflexaceae bacterium]|nr:hypothetical protein [Chloroflexaceae bacterium]NJO04256.1 hypothetical protein [Chloroflexaceae bacterium]NJO84717.1 hypothetical protein [Blastochloris sp.]
MAGTEELTTQEWEVAATTFYITAAGMMSAESGGFIREFEAMVAVVNKYSDNSGTNALVKHLLATQPAEKQQELEALCKKYSTQELRTRSLEHSRSLASALDDKVSADEATPYLQLIFDTADAIAEAAGTLGYFSEDTGAQVSEVEAAFLIELKQALGLAQEA